MTGRSEQAWQALRSAILTGTLAPGEPLRFQQLQKMCGVSVSSLREALARLVAAGLVEGEHNRGYWVTSLTRAQLDDLVRLRIQLEGWALERSIAAGDEDWEARVMADLHRLERFPRELGDKRLHNEEWELRHASFHATLISACDSPTLLEFCDQLYVRSDRYRRLSLTVEAEPRAVQDEHRAILEAAINRKTPVAKSLLAAHYEATAAIVRKYLDERELPRERAVHTPARAPRRRKTAQG